MRTHFTILIGFILTSLTATSQEYFNSYSFGGTAIDGIVGSTIDSEGNIYGTGLYVGSLTFGDTTITFAGGNVDAYLTKFSPTGEPLWIKSFGGLADDAGFEVVVNSQNEVIIMGYFQGAGNLSFDADPGPDQYWLSQPAPFLSRDCFIIKLTSNGDFIWAKQISNPTAFAQEDGFAVEIDENDNIYVGGRYQYADFDPSPDGEAIHFSYNDGQYFNGFLVKLDTDGNYQWVKTLESSGHGGIYSIDRDGDGNIFVTGTFENTIDLDPSEEGEDSHTSSGSKDIFIVKLDPSGEYIWGKTVGGAGLDISEDMIVAADGIYICGGIFESADMDPGDDVYTITATQNNDGMVAKYDLDGNIIWAFTIGGISNSNLEEAYSIQQNADGNLSVSGVFFGTADMDPGEEVASATSLGLGDHYVLRISPEGEYLSHVRIGGTGAETKCLHQVDVEGKFTVLGTFSSSLDLDPTDGFAGATSNGAYDVYLTQFTMETDSVSGMNEVFPFDGNLISIYPNPVVDQLNINTPLALKSATIYDIAGRQVAAMDLNGQKVINVANLAKGVYILRLVSQDSKVFGGKFVR